MIKVTVWSEHVQDRGIEAFPPDSPLLQNPELREFLEFSAREIKKVHPNGLHQHAEGAARRGRGFLRSRRHHGNARMRAYQEVLDDTDVLVWWAHVAHDQVPDEIAFRVRDAVWKGMGFIGLHSAHPSKPMQLLVGASGSLKWREGDRARVWCCNPTHPIAEGIPESFELENEEMYGEPFDIATPDELVFISWFAGGEVFRSGCCWNRGRGKVFYFQPGHETQPSYYVPEVRRIIKNAVRWAKPVCRLEKIECPHAKIRPEDRYKK